MFRLLSALVFCNIYNRVACLAIIAHGDQIISCDVASSDKLGPARTGCFDFVLAPPLNPRLAKRIRNAIQRAFDGTYFDSCCIPLSCFTAGLAAHM